MDLKVWGSNPGLRGNLFLFFSSRMKFFSTHIHEETTEVLSSHVTVQYLDITKMLDLQFLNILVIKNLIDGV